MCARTWHSRNMQSRRAFITGNLTHTRGVGVAHARSPRLWHTCAMLRRNYTRTNFHLLAMVLRMCALQTKIVPPPDDRHKCCFAHPGASFFCFKAHVNSRCSTERCNRVVSFACLLYCARARRLTSSKIDALCIGKQCVRASPTPHISLSFLRAASDSKRCRRIARCPTPVLKRFLHAKHTHTERLRSHRRYRTHCHSSVPTTRTNNLERLI